MKPFVFYWVNYSGVPQPMCGSDGVIRLDGRNNIATMKNNAIDLVRTRRCRDRIIGYSIGELVCHDPNEVHSQCYVPLTLF